MAEKRADVLLSEQDLLNSRSQTQRAIMAGLVNDYNHQRIDKSGEKFSEGEIFYAKDDGKKYVSRGGFKLEKALQVFNINLKDEICLDIGALMGGFTDVALQNGAKLVHTLDVGYNQLAWELRDNPQAIVMEKQNFRHSKSADSTDGFPDFAMTDVSFISLGLTMPSMHEILKDQCDVVCLIKPQFEAGPENAGKHGIIHDHDVHANVTKYTMRMAQKIGFNIPGVDHSPTKGGKRNIEFLIHLGKDLANPGQDPWQGNPTDVVQRVVSGLQVRKMLVELGIKDFAIIKTPKVRLQEKMIALIGETDVGKSITIDAVSLLLGSRA